MVVLLNPSASIYHFTEDDSVKIKSYIHQLFDQHVSLNPPWQDTALKAAPRWGSPLPDQYYVQSAVAARPSQPWNAWGQIPVNTRGTPYLVWVYAPQNTSATKGISSPLHPEGRHRTQGSQLTWTKILLWPPRMPRSYFRSPFTQTRRNYHPHPNQKCG